MLSCVIQVLCLTAQKGMALILTIPLLSYLLLLTFVELFPSAGTMIWQSKETSNTASTEQAGRTHSTEKKSWKICLKQDIFPKLDLHRINAWRYFCVSE